LVIVYKPVEGISQRGLSLFLQRARTAVHLPGDVNVMLTSSGHMRTLNRQFRGKDRATDVLSFPSPPALAAQFSGDIAISIDIAAQNASRYGHSLMHEIKVLLLHGVLHLAGYDHEQDNGVMAGKEERLRRQLRLSDGLIARTGKPSRSVATQGAEATVAQKVSGVAGARHSQARPRRAGSLLRNVR
jgi:probable rRNA maturation factor